MFLFLAVWLNFCGTFVHPWYISITNMDVDEQKGDIVLRINLFVDELEVVLHNKYNIDGWLGTAAEHSDSRRLLMEYVNERLSVTVNNGEKIELVTDSITFNKEEEAMLYFYMRGIAKQAIRRIEVDNRLLTEFFSNQTNLVYIDVRRGLKAYKLNRNKHKIELSL